MSLMEVAVLILLFAILIQTCILDERVKLFRIKFDDLSHQFNCETCKVANVCECKVIKEDQ